MAGKTIENGSKTAGNSSVTGADNRFSKEQLISSGKYRARRDLLEVLLEDGKDYTIQETDAVIGKFMKGRVG